MAPYAIEVDARASAGAIPNMWRPSAYLFNASAQHYSQFQSIRGPRGVTRGHFPFGAYDMSAATSLSDYIARVTLYCAQPQFIEAIGRGTVVLEVNGMPRFLSSSVDTTPLPGSGWPVYRTARPASYDDFQAAMAELVDTVMNVLGHPAPRNPSTGKLEFGRPGVVFEFWNEPNGDGFLGYLGGATMKDYLLMYQRAYIGGRSANASCCWGGPSVSGYADRRVDRVYASTSADVLTSSRFTGGTEGVGRSGGAEFRNYFTFPASGFATGAIQSVQLSTFNIANEGNVSAETWSIRPYNTNGQGAPATESPISDVYNRCASGTAYVSGYTGWRSINEALVTLGSQAAIDLAAAVSAGVNWSLASTMTGAGSGLDRRANPAGFNNGSGIGVWPHLRVTYEKTMIEQFCDFTAAQGCEPDCLIFHNFQDSPDHHVAEAQALVTSALSNAGLDASTPIILTEYQHHDKAGAQAGTRDDYRSASYTLSALWEHWQAGFDSMCQVMTKFEATTTPAALFVDSWGQIVISSPAYPAAVSSFMVMRLFDYWRDGYSVAITPESISEIGLRQYAARSGDVVFVVLTRWDPGEAEETITVRIAEMPGKRGLRGRMWKFGEDGRNDVKYAYTNAPGEDADRAQAAVTLGARGHPEAITSSPVRIKLKAQECAFLCFPFKDAS